MEVLWAADSLSHKWPFQTQIGLGKCFDNAHLDSQLAKTRRQTKIKITV